MKRFLTLVLGVSIAIVIFVGAAAGFYLFEKYYPSRELADHTEWFGVTGDEVAVILDNERQEEIFGRYVDGQVYLPLSWINENLNERFYWDEAEKQLIYALPDSIEYVEASDVGEDGRPLLIEQKGAVWLKTGLIGAYTDVRIEIFDQGEVKRVFVDTDWSPQQVSIVKRNGSIRVRGGIKSDILTRAAKNTEVVVLGTLERWSEVRTMDGYVGYIPNRLLGTVQERIYTSTFEEPTYTNISMEEPVCLVWHQVMVPEANKNMEKLIANTKGVNVIAPTWFMLTDNEGNYDSLADRSYVDQAHHMGMQVWAVLDNFNKGEKVRSEILFASTKARKKLIASLLQDVEKYDLDGINLDIESIQPEAGPHYVQFIRELSVDCRKHGIVLSVDSYVPSAYTEFYNRAEQGRVTDYVIIMGYDEHYTGSEAGSVASLGFERQGIEDTLKQVPAEKIISAIPFYTRIWKQEGEEKTSSMILGISRAESWVKENKMELHWQEELGQYYGELREEDALYRLWMEEERSIGKKMELIRDYGLAGVACWKLGLEPAKIWDAIHP